MLLVTPYMFAGSGRIITKIILHFFIINILVVFLQHGLFAQSPGSVPRIGLALSGNGSKGIAHIGVLKVMEEAGLRPDYISGVSMGSIIGGMYSVGYKADTLHELLNKTDRDLILSNRIPEDRIIYMEKRHYNNSIMSLPVSYSKVKLPSGLINGQQIENILTAPVLHLCQYFYNNHQKSIIGLIVAVNVLLKNNCRNELMNSS